MSSLFCDGPSPERVAERPDSGNLKRMKEGCKMPRTLCLLVALGAVVLVSFPSWAGEIYRWTDERGTVHLTDDPSKIPEAYQNRVKKVDVPEETPKDIPTVPKQKSPSEDRVKQYLEEMDRKIDE